MCWGCLAARSGRKVPRTTGGGAPNIGSEDAAAARQEAAHDCHLTLAELRRAQALTQVQLARALGITQAEVSRIEHQADLLLSTLASYVTAAGGSLQLLVEFAHREPIVIDLDVLGPTQHPTPATTQS